MTTTRMKTATTLAIVLAGGAMLLTTAAMAHGPGKAELDFTAIDADGNGEITAAEFDAHRLARIAAVDADGDGFISMEELQAMRDGRAAERAEKRFERITGRLDENGDGLISVDEFAAMAGERRGGADGIPRGLDADGSGGVSEAEMAAFLEAMQDRRGKGGHWKHGGHGRGH